MSEESRDLFWLIGIFGLGERSTRRTSLKYFD